jgi:hypothetical protein
MRKIATWCNKFFIVAGCLLSLLSAGIDIQPVNRSIIFLKEKDIVLSSDHWRTEVDVDVKPYEEATVTIKEDLLTAEKRSKEFSFISELRSIQTLLTVLESKLYSFKQIFPKLDSRRGLFNFGGSNLKTLFGTAVVADVTHLHNVFYELQSRQQDVVRSLKNQVTYIKRLDEITNVHVEAIANLSGIFRDNIIRSHDKFQEIARDILWLNLTIHGQNELNTTIREMEFSILRLTQQLDELINATQFMGMGKLPVI